MKKNPESIINRIIVIMLYIIIFMAPLIFSKYTKQNFLEAKEFFLIYSVSILIFVNSLYLYFKKNISDFWNTWLARISVLFVLSMLISLFNTDNMAMSMDRFIRVIIYFVILWVAYENLRDHEQMSTLFFLTIIAGGMVSLYGIAQYFGIDPFFPKGQVWGNTGRLQVFSTFGNPNFLADYLVVPFPIAFMFFIEYSKKLKGKIAGISFLLMLLVILFTRTRGAWISVMFATIYIFIMIFKFRRKLFKQVFKYLAIVLLICILVIALLSTVRSTREKTLNLIKTVEGRFTSSTTVMQRWLMWNVTLEAAMDHPIIGHGLNMFKKIYSKYQHDYFKRWSEKTGKPAFEHPYKEFAIDFRHTHNDYLQTLCEQGIIGLILFICLFGTGIYNGFKLMKKDEHFYLNLGLTASVICVMTEAIFNFPFHRAAPYLTAITVLMGIQWQTRKEVEFIPDKKDKIANMAIVIISLIIMINGLYVGYKKNMASVLHKSGHVLITRKRDFKVAEVQLRRSIQYDNSEGEAFYWYAYSLFVQNKKKDALKIFKESLNYSHNKLSHLHLGLCYMDPSIHEYEKALEQFDFVKYSDPSNPYSYFYKYVVYDLLEKNNNNKDQKYGEKKKEELRLAFMNTKGDITNINNVFAINAINNKNEKAIQLFIEKAEMNKVDVQILNNLLFEYFDKIPENKKEIMLKDVVRKTTDLTRKFSIIAYSIKKGYEKTVKPELENIMRQNPNLADSYYYYSLILQKEGKTKEAQEYRNKYEKFNIK